MLIYKLDPAKGTLTPNDPAFGATPPGGGPRHFAFHPSGRFAYVCNEMTSAGHGVRLRRREGRADRDPDDHHAAAKRRPATRPPRSRSIRRGKFLYCSNRGHDSLAIFTIDEKTGKLTAAGHQKTRGKTPRNFGIDPTGTYVIACNQRRQRRRVQGRSSHRQADASRRADHRAAALCVKFLAVE